MLGESWLVAPRHAHKYSAQVRCRGARSHQDSWEVVANVAPGRWMEHLAGGCNGGHSLALADRRADIIAVGQSSRRHRSDWIWRRHWRQDLRAACQSTGSWQRQSMTPVLVGAIGRWRRCRRRHRCPCINKYRITYSPLRPYAPPRAYAPGACAASDRRLRRCVHNCSARRS